MRYRQSPVSLIQPIVLDFLQSKYPRYYSLKEICELSNLKRSTTRAHCHELVRKKLATRIECHVINAQGTKNRCFKFAARFGSH